MAAVAEALTTTELESFRTNGFLGPFPGWTPAEMAAMVPRIEAVLESTAPDHKSNGHNRHLDKRLIYDLATCRPILERMRCLYGPDLMLWRTNFFIKEPGAREIPWHQDFNYWPLEPPIIISAWIAVDPATVENSCVQVIPGSHRKVIPHVKATPDMVFAEMGNQDYYDTSKLVNLEMQPGEFILFNERTLHHSEPNRSDLRRIGLAIRVVIPIVKVLSWDSPRHGLQLISGEDRLNFNRRSPIPSA